MCSGLLTDFTADSYAVYFDIVAFFVPLTALSFISCGQLLLCSAISKFLQHNIENDDPA